MHKFRIKLPFNEEEIFYNKTELLNFKITLLLAKSDTAGSNHLIKSNSIKKYKYQIVSNHLIF